MTKVQSSFKAKSAKHLAIFVSHCSSATFERFIARLQLPFARRHSKLFTKRSRKRAVNTRAPAIGNNYVIRWLAVVQRFRFRRAWAIDEINFSRSWLDLCSTLFTLRITIALNISHWVAVSTKLAHHVQSVRMVFASMLIVMELAPLSRLSINHIRLS